MSEAFRQIESLHINYRYLIFRLRSFHELVPQFANRQLRILDYGCGNGEVVLAGLEHQLDIYGADVFYAGAQETISQHPLFGDRIKKISDDKLDFKDGFFDVVVANMVFEHIRDLHRVLREINRVLKSDGALLALFPTREIFREGHIGIPFVHWFTRDSQIRYGYTYFLRRIGLGYFKKGLSIRDWTISQLNWIDNYVVYRTYTDVRRHFSVEGFNIRHIELDYIKYRLAMGGRSINFLDHALFASMATYIFQRLAFVAILACKHE
jgi:SAM-dependent methyltransferase